MKAAPPANPRNRTAPRFGALRARLLGSLRAFAARAVAGLPDRAAVGSKLRGLCRCTVERFRKVCAVTAFAAADLLRRTALGAKLRQLCRCTAERSNVLRASVARTVADLLRRAAVGAKLRRLCRCAAERFNVLRASVARAVAGRLDRTSAGLKQLSWWRRATAWLGALPAGARSGFPSRALQRAGGLSLPFLTTLLPLICLLLLLGPPPVVVGSGKDAPARGTLFAHVAPFAPAMPSAPERLVGPAPPAFGPPRHTEAPVRNNEPFAGWELRDVTAELQRRYAGRRSATWAEKMPGITSRLTPEPGPAKPAMPSGKPGKPAAAPGPPPTAQSASSGPRPVLALTLDACSGEYDAELIAFLRDRNIPATLFVAGPWLRRNPEAFKKLAADPLFEIAAHGNAHKPCSVDGQEVYGIKGTSSMAELVKEVESNARALQKAGAPRPRWFRSATAFYDDVAVAVIHDLGMNVAGYSIAVDQGATLPAERVCAKALGAKNGDILLAHMNHPKAGTRKGLMEALPQLQKRGFVFVRLSDYGDGGSAPRPPAGDSIPCRGSE